MDKIVLKQEVHRCNQVIKIVDAWADVIDSVGHNNVPQGVKSKPHNYLAAGSCYFSENLRETS
jgi:hypothetical protein